MPTRTRPGIGGRNGCWHFSDEEKLEIVEGLNGGIETVAELAQRYGVHHSVIRRVHRQAMEEQ